MPKQKTHSGLKKRIKVTGKGKLMRGRAYKNHLAKNQKFDLRYVIGGESCQE